MKERGDDEGWKYITDVQCKDILYKRAGWGPNVVRFS